MHNEQFFREPPILWTFIEEMKNKRPLGNYFPSNLFDIIAH